MPQTMLLLKLMERYCPKCFQEFPADLERCPNDGTILVAAAEANLVGTVLDERYSVVSKAGQGGMGVVYVAEQSLVGRKVALKVLRADAAVDKAAVRRFLNEAKAIASLQSRHTVTLYDFGVTSKGLIYYTMELLEGRPLSKLIRQEGPLDYRRAADFVYQVLDSLEEAHEHRILHRDLKPDNIFVTRNRGKEHAKVLDFGIAKLLGDTSIDKVTKTGMICGTPQYLSPEQALGNPVVPASDLYSLGIVFYEMLAGTPPFIETTPMKILLQHLNDRPEPVSIRNPKVEVPASIEALLHKALEKNHERRYRSVAEFRQALEEALETHNVHPETTSLSGLSTTAGGLRELRRTDPQYGDQPIDGDAPMNEPALVCAKGEREGESHRPARPGAGAGGDGTRPRVVEESPPSCGLAPQAQAVQSGPGSSEAGHSSGLLARESAPVHARRNRALWMAIGSVVLVLCVVLAFWHPWIGSSEPVALTPADTIAAPPSEVGNVGAPTQPAQKAPGPAAHAVMRDADVSVDGGRLEAEPAGSVSPPDLSQVTTHAERSEPAEAAEPPTSGDGPAAVFAAPVVSPGEAETARLDGSSAVSQPLAPERQPVPAGPLLGQEPASPPPSQVEQRVGKSAGGGKKVVASDSGMVPADGKVVKMAAGERTGKGVVGQFSEAPPSGKEASEGLGAHLQPENPAERSGDGAAGSEEPGRLGFKNIELPVEPKGETPSDPESDTPRMGFRPVELSP